LLRNRSNYRQRSHRAYVAHTILLTLTTVAVSCSPLLPFDRALIERLQNRGPTALSNDNAYLAPNLLIAKEMERREEVRGFIEAQGVPQAIAVRKSLFGSTSITAYYVREAKAYLLEEENDGWIITGPERLSGELLTALHIIASKSDNPSIVISSPGEGDTTKKSIVKIPATRSAQPGGKATLPIVTPPKQIEPLLQKPKGDKKSEKTLPKHVTPPTPRATPEIAVELDNHTPKKDSPPELAPSQTPSPVRSLEPLSTLPPPVVSLLTPKPEKVPQQQKSEQQQHSEVQLSNKALELINKLVSSEDLSPAEETPRGDIVHYVTSPQETLSIIALWYSGEKENNERLGRINRIKGESLSPGDTLVIPRYMVKNKKILSSALVEKIAASAGNN
jgi:hypothetical protein